MPVSTGSGSPATWRLSTDLHSPAAVPAPIESAGNRSRCPVRRRRPVRRSLAETQISRFRCPTRPLMPSECSGSSPCWRFVRKSSLSHRVCRACVQRHSFARTGLRSRHHQLRSLSVGAAPGSCLNEAPTFGGTHVFTRNSGVTSRLAGRGSGLSKLGCSIEGIHPFALKRTSRVREYHAKHRAS